ncbi:MAG: TauD/TfdA family dioxygenase [Acetobacteraceae bacterium]
MLEVARREIEGRAVWRGADLERSGDWTRQLGDEHRAEIDAALLRVKRSGQPLFSFTKNEFSLPRTAGLLAEIGEELENGRGAVRLRGLPVDRYTEDDIRHIFWGVAYHLGTPVFQNMTGEIMGEVRDETRDANPSFAKSEPGKVVSSRARSRSTGPLRFHTDGSDVIALLCVRNAKAGGVSKLASIPMIHNEMLRRRPDLLEELFHEYWRARPKEQYAVLANPCFALPVFGVRDGKITSQYSRTFVELAQEFPDIPRLRATQDEALDLLAEIAEETCLHSAFEPGDLQLLNNHVVYHGRTAYEDDAAQRQDRLLLRLWLSATNSRTLPDGFDAFWGSIKSGVLRGGVPQRDGRRAAI